MQLVGNWERTKAKNDKDSTNNQENLFLSATKKKIYINSSIE